MEKKIELIEFLKGYSIFTIVIFHYLQTFHWQNITGKLIFFGGTGVHLFILLSGFGLYYSHLRKPLNYRKFISKRFTKIYFPYILIVLISALISLFIPIFKNSLYALGGHIFLYKMFDESIMGSYGYPLWFISMIIQFYFAFYAIIWLRIITGEKLFLLISLLISILWTLIIISSGNDIFRIWNSFFLKYLWEFALGMYLAEYFTKNKYSTNFKIQPIVILIFGLLNCVLYALLALKVGTTGKMLNDIPALLGYTSIAIWIYQFKNKYINTFFNYTGKISYSFYLLHSLVLLLLIYLIHSIWHPLLLIIALLITFFFSHFYHKLIIEKTIIKRN